MGNNIHNRKAKLSPAELDDLLAVKKKWVDTIFFSGDSCDENRIKEGVEWLYSTKKKPGPKLLILDSPFRCFEEEKKIKKSSGLKGGHWFMLHSQSCLSSIWPFIEEGMMTSLCASSTLHGTGSSKIVSTAYYLDLLKKYSEAGAMATLAERLFNDLERTAERNSCVSEENLLMMIGKITAYDYLRKERGILCDFLDEYISLLEAGCFLSIFSYEHALVSRRPLQTKIKNMTLHCEDGPAIEWRDGSKLFYLNGVMVSEKIVMTPADTLDPRHVIGTKNAEVRKEIIRKIGIDTVISAFKGNVIDTWGEYKLIRLDIPDIFFNVHYLRMTNPSTGGLHFEGVPPHVKTCTDALSWRVGGLEWAPEQLT
jgi:hypothetical protein